MIDIDEMLEPDEQAEFIALTGALLDKDGYDTEHYNSPREFRRKMQFNTGRLISFGGDSEEIELCRIEGTINLGGKKYGFSGEVYAYAVDTPQDYIDYDVIKAKWDNPGKAPKRKYHDTHAVKSVVENYFEAAKRTR
jgi:hypothetical protein